MWLKPQDQVTQFVGHGARLLNSCKVGCRNRVPGIFIPQLEFVQLPHQHRLLVELGVLTQTGRHQETPTAV